MAAIVSDCMEYEYKPEGLNLCCEKCPAGESQSIFWILVGWLSKAREGRLWALGAELEVGWGELCRLRWVDLSLAPTHPLCAPTLEGFHTNRFVGLFCWVRCLQQVEDKLGVHT